MRINSLEASDCSEFREMKPNAREINCDTISRHLVHDSMRYTSREYRSIKNLDEYCCGEKVI